MRQSSSTSTQPSFTLHAFGPCRLTHAGSPVPVRRKSLALLYYLSLEGPTRRERLADLLWEGPSGLQNLRVELSDLRKTFYKAGTTGFGSGEDPLELPEVVRLDMTSYSGKPHTCEPLEGLDDLSPTFQEWLGWRRLRLSEAGESAANPYQTLLDELAGHFKTSSLLMVEALPGSSAFGFAEALAAHLGLPLRTSVAERGRCVRYLAAPYPEGVLEAVLQNRDDIWVVERPFFGEDSQLLLQLRSRVPAARSRYIVLKRMSWCAARGSLLAKLTFTQAAKLQLASQGHPDYIHEMLDVPNSLQGEVAVSRRFQAALQLEARELSPQAHEALKRLSVHPGYLDLHKLALLDAEAYVEELERQRWLELCGANWCFTSELLRSVIYKSLSPGQRTKHHLKLAQGIEQGDRLGALYHRYRAGERLEPLRVLPLLPMWARFAFGCWCGHRLPRRAPVQSEVGCGPELLLEESYRFGRGLEQQGESWALERSPLSAEPSGVAWSLPKKPCLLRLRGRAFIDNALGFGASGQSVPLRLKVRGGSVAEAVFVPGAEAAWTPSQVLLPLGDSFDHWLFIPVGDEVVLESKAEQAILEFEVQCFSVDNRAAWRVQAFLLEVQGVD